MWQLSTQYLVPSTECLLRGTVVVAIACLACVTQATWADDTSSFAQKLKTSKFFSDVSIKKASQKTDSGSVEWEITCRVNYSA